MATQPTPSGPIAFGPFEWNPLTSDLRKHGIRIRLASQPSALLAALLEHPGEVVSREELRQRLWGGDTFVDYERGLNAAVNKLRQSLGDSAQSPRYIETFAGRGYRFIGPVEHTPIPRLAVIAPPPAEEPKRSWLPWILPACIVMIVAAWLGFLRNTGSSIPPRLLEFSIDAPPGLAIAPSGARKGFEVSPDGKRVVFTASDTRGTFTLWLRDLARLESRQIPGAGGTHAVFWSADSDSVYYTAGDQVRRMGTGGGPSEIVFDGINLGFFGATFTPRRELIVADGGGIHQVGASGASKRIGLAGEVWPQVLPDGRTFLYAQFDAATGHFRIRLARLDGSAPARDLREADSRAVYVPSSLHTGAGYLMFVSAGTLVAQPFDLSKFRFPGDPIPIAQHIYAFITTGAADFSASSNGVLAYLNFANRSEVRWMERSGAPGPVVGDPMPAAKYVRLSPDGKTIAAAVYNADRCSNELWLIDVATGRRWRLAERTGIDEAPVWSPDSRALVYGRAYGSPPRLYRRGIGVNDVDQPLPSGPFQVPTSWSPDGRFIAYTNASFPSAEGDRKGDVSLIDLSQPGGRIVPLLNSPFREREAMFSPDGKAIAFLSNESGVEEVYTQRFESAPAPHVFGPRHLISQGGAISLRWRRDGREIIYLSPDGFFYAVPVSPVYEAAGPREALFRIAPESLSILPTDFGFDISPDGRRLLIANALGKSSLTVVDNWELLLH